MHLLYPQAEVEDAVRAVGLAVWPSYFSDEARQSKAQLISVALKDVVFNSHLIGYRAKRSKSSTARMIEC